ncbi:MAG: alpha-amylase family glycosyl hydrolase, partial [archaeon]|nr:alpha-amylase family glycosyl hydrolase [archaeon]
ISLIFLLICISFVYNIKYNSNPLNPTILQISTRPFLYQLSKERGLTLKTLRDIPDDVIEEWSNLKFDFVWFMGVWQVGPYGIEHDRTDEGLVKGFKEILPDYISEDAIGSPYAITDYVCNSELCPNGDNDLIYIRDKLNKKNIKLMLDFVPNHSALDSPWVDESMDYYIRAPKELSPPYDPSKYFTNGIAYGNMQYSSAWTDVGQLNYWNNNTRILMTNKLKRVASLADGIRCDMAYIILNDYFQGTWQTELNSWGYTKPSTEFWSDAIKEIKKTYPSTLFLAEVYGDYFKNLIEEGFDYTYDKELLDRFKSGHLDNTRAWITSMIPYNNHVCRFLENHDDNRAVTAFGGNYKMTMAAAVGTYTLPGLRFLFQDQWFCYRNKLDVHLRRSYSENKIEDCEKFYKTFFTIFTDEIFKNGEWTYLNVLGDSAWRLMAWSWVGPSGNKRLVALNFSQEQAGGNIVLSDLRGSGQVTLKELFSGVEYIRSADEIRDTGLVVVLESMQAQIFTYE